MLCVKESICPWASSCLSSASSHLSCPLSDLYCEKLVMSRNLDSRNSSNFLRVWYYNRIDPQGVALQNKTVDYVPWHNTRLTSDVCKPLNVNYFPPSRRGYSCWYRGFISSNFGCSLFTCSAFWTLTLLISCSCSLKRQKVCSLDRKLIENLEAESSASSHTAKEAQPRRWIKQEQRKLSAFEPVLDIMVIEAHQCSDLYSSRKSRTFSR